MTIRQSTRDFLGDAADDLTDDQIEQIDDLLAATKLRWPDPDEWDDRNVAITAGMQVMLGEDTLETVAAKWHAAKATERTAMVALTGAILGTTGSERELIARTGVARMTVRKALGRA